MRDGFEDARMLAVLAGDIDFEQRGRERHGAKQHVGDIRIVRDDIAPLRLGLGKVGGRWLYR